LLPEEEANLRNAVDLSCRVLLCPEASREFLACDYNKIGAGIYRSPWSNKPVHLGSSGMEPSDEIEATQEGPTGSLRDLEVLANKAFESYRQLYYEGGGISSVYVWPVNPENVSSFGMAILLKKCNKQFYISMNLIAL